MSKLRIKSVEVGLSEFSIPDLGLDPSGFSLIYDPGGKKKVKAFSVIIKTNEGINGEFVGGDAVGFAQLKKFIDHVIGKDPLQRELIYNDAKRCLRKFDKMGMGMIDIPLWDLAGKLYNCSIGELLGGYRTKLPTYASTMSGDRAGGLSSPEAFGDFAIQCKEMGYKGFKIHIWEDYTISELKETILEVREAVGDGFPLMIDPACKLRTFTEVLLIGQACDEANYLWLEDAYRDSGVSTTAHKMLRQRLKTPILQTEHVRGLEEHVNFIVAEGTDFVRADAEYDGGVTGASKIAHASEGFGLDVELHGPHPAHRQLMAGIRNSNFYEMSLVHPKTPEIGRCMDIYADNYKDGLNCIDKNGCVEVPVGPGLGIKYDWKFIKENEVSFQKFE